MQRYFVPLLVCCAFNFSVASSEMQFPFPLTSDAIPEFLVDDVFPESEYTVKAPNFNDVLKLDARLKTKVIDQSEAIDLTTQAVIRYAAGINDPNSPVAVLLYVGPSGVGKTELAKALAADLYGSERALIRFNMQEFSDGSGVHRLTGAPHGYKDSEQGGELTNAIWSHPDAVILLDEMDKAHPKVQKLFLQLFDEGFITSELGRVCDARNIVFIMTSNYAAAEIIGYKRAGYSREEILNAIEPMLTQAMSPELYNRLTPVLFYPLTAGSVERIVAKLLKELDLRVYRARGIYLSFDKSLAKYLTEEGMHPTLGARPLKRLIETDLTTICAKAILEGRVKKGDVLALSYKDGIVSVK